MYFDNENDLRNFILDELFNRTYRDLIADNKFKYRTGIKSLGTLTYYAKKMNINIEEVYNRAILTNRIRSNCSYEDFLHLTHRENVVNKVKHKNKIKERIEKNKRDIICNIGKEIGFTFSKEDNIEYMLNCLYDFIDKETLDKKINELMNL